MSIKIFLLFLLGLVPSLLSSTAIKKTDKHALLPEALKKIQAAWDAAPSYQADFKQIIHGKRTGTQDVSIGKLSVVKPGKLRWESTQDQTTQILNGKRFISLRTNKRRGVRTVEIYEDISSQMDVKMLEFLAGKAKFKEWYKCELADETPEILALKLTPKNQKNPTPSDVYIAEFDKKGYTLRALMNESADSKVRIDFSNIQTNGKLSEDLFEYKAEPKDVVHKQ
jgi:outer membrane lipoprotein-sorting protein